MTQRVVIGWADTTFSAHCDLCGTAFAGRLDADLEEGRFLCREGHIVRIVRGHDPPQETHAAADAA
jgi:hypothetical protein